MLMEMKTESKMGTTIVILIGTQATMDRFNGHTIVNSMDTILEILGEEAKIVAKPV